MIEDGEELCYSQGFIENIPVNVFMTVFVRELVNGNTF
jgi:hypothetical protein